LFERVWRIGGFLAPIGRIRLLVSPTRVMNVIVTVSRGKESTYMKTFTIDAENNIGVHTSRKAARETGAGVFASEAQFAELIGPDYKRLVEIWNGLTGMKPITKFANRKSAIERIWKALQSFGEQAAASVPETPFDAPETEAAPTELPAAEPKLAEAEAERPQEDSTLQAEIEPVVLTAPNAAEPAANSGGQELRGVAEEKNATEKTSSTKKTPKAKKAAKPARLEESAGPREGSKTARVVELLKRESGATLEEIMQQMGWQKHTVRGFMAGAMKKAGYAVESFKSEKGERSYRINL
jgi:hypothetical protein